MYNFYSNFKHIFLLYVELCLTKSSRTERQRVKNNSYSKASLSCVLGVYHVWVSHREPDQTQNHESEIFIQIFFKTVIILHATPAFLGVTMQ